MRRKTPTLRARLHSKRYIASVTCVSSSISSRPMLAPCYSGITEDGHKVLVLRHTMANRESAIVEIC